MQRENGSLRIFVLAMIAVSALSCGASSAVTKTSGDASALTQIEESSASDAAPGEIGSNSVEPTDAVTSTEAESTDVTPGDDTAAVDPVPVGLEETKILRFEWCPKAKAKASYELPEEEDQHRIVLPKGLVKGESYPVVVAFHGQPKRGKDPRNYSFMEPVQQKVLAMVDNDEIQPVILVMPAFRFLGSNWPYFNPKKFKEEVVAKLEAEGFSATDWYAFGHSGAAGCGGGGLNQIHLMSPKGVGFFDTCLGDGWQEEVVALQNAKIETFNIHSVETAGFKPRQRPEYQAYFDFGRAYSPVGIEPVECPAVHPGKKLRTLKHRCSATKDGIIKGFVIDTGEGAAAHKAILQPAIDFFLKYFLKK